jgi:hypothetical protein
MTTDIINELQYGVVLCQRNGDMLYTNDQASKIFNCPSGNLNDYNILSYIDEYFHNKVKMILSEPDQSILSFGHDFIYVKLNGLQSKIYKLKFKKTKDDNILLMIYDYTTNKLDRDNLIKNISQMNDSVTRNNIVLKTISHIINNFFYKDRSMIKDILVDISSAFRFKNSAVCFKNGTNHVITCKRLRDNTYEVENLNGEQISGHNNCIIWNQEQQHSGCKDLIFQAPCNITCSKLYYNQNESNKLLVQILKLKLNDDTVIGFLSFIEDDRFKLSNSDLEILESLSQILAYIINNKEQIDDVTKYIKEKFSNLTVHKK